MSRDEYALRELLRGADGAEPVEDTWERLSSLTPDEFYRGQGGLVALFQAAMSGTSRQVAEILTQAAAVDRAQEFVTRTDGLGRTALHYAAREAVSNESSARVLVDHACSRLVMMSFLTMYVDACVDGGEEHIDAQHASRCSWTLAQQSTVRTRTGGRR